MKTAYGMRISYWGADVCSSVLRHLSHRRNLRRPGRSWQGLACRSGKSRLILSLFGGAGWLVQMRPSAAPTSPRAQARFSTSGAVGHPPSIEFRAVRWTSGMRQTDSTPSSPPPRLFRSRTQIFHECSDNETQCYDAKEPDQAQTAHPNHQDNAKQG